MRPKRSAGGAAGRQTDWARRLLGDQKPAPPPPAPIGSSRKGRDLPRGGRGSGALLTSGLCRSRGPHCCRSHRHGPTWPRVRASAARRPAGAGAGGAAGGTGAGPGRPGPRGLGRRRAVAAAAAPRGRGAGGPLRDSLLGLGRAGHHLLAGGGARPALRRRPVAQRRAPGQGQRRALLLPEPPAAVGGRPAGESVCHADHVFGSDRLLQEARVRPPESPLCAHHPCRDRNQGERDRKGRGEAGAVHPAPGDDVLAFQPRLVLCQVGHNQHLGPGLLRRAQDSDARGVLQRHLPVKRNRVAFLGSSEQTRRAAGFSVDRAPEDPPVRFPLGAGGLACLENQVGLLLGLLEDEVADVYRSERLVSVPIHVVSADEIRSLVKRCVRNQAPEPFRGSDAGLNTLMFANSKEIQQAASG